MKKRTKIEDLPAPEKELTDSEAKKIKGGLISQIAGVGKTTTGMAEDLTQPPGQNTLGERDQSTD